MLKVVHWISIAAIGGFIAGACSTDDDSPTTGVSGDAGKGGSSVGHAGEAGSSVSTGGSTIGAGGTAGAEGGVGWTCDAGYVLGSYDGDQSDLCAASESRWVDCCNGPGADVADAIVTRCAPDGSICLADSYCTTFNTSTLECGWKVCDPDNPSGAGGAGGAANSDCPWDKAREALDRALNDGGGPVPCATDLHCEKTHQVCNVRWANRMFCGDPDSSTGGGSGGSGG